MAMRDVCLRTFMRFAADRKIGVRIVVMTQSTMRAITRVACSPDRMFPIITAGLPLFVFKIIHSFQL